MESSEFVQLSEYIANYPISYYHVDPKGYLSPIALLYALQESALDHCKHWGHDVITLKDQNSGWAVLSWHIKINRFPELWDSMNIKTWTSKFGRMQVSRSYSIKHNDEEVIKVISQWALIDLEKRIPKVPTEDFTNHCCDREPAIPREKFFSVTKKDNLGELIKTSTFNVKRTDIDTNDHVNNVKYVEWSINDIPDDLYNDYYINEIRIVYRKECALNDIVTMFTYRNNDHVTFIIENQDNKKLVEISYDFLPF